MHQLLRIPTKLNCFGWSGQGEGEEAAIRPCRQQCWLHVHFLWAPVLHDPVRIGEVSGSNPAPFAASQALRPGRRLGTSQIHATASRIWSNMGISVGQLLPDHRNDRQHGRAVLLGSLSGCSRFGVLFDSPHSVLFVVPPVLELPLPGQLKKAWVEDPGCFRHPVPSLARTDLLDTCKALIGVRAMMKKIVDECATAKLPEFSKVSMKFLEPKMVEDKLHWVTDAYLGKSSSEVDVLENLKQWLELRHLGVMYAVTATQDDINNQWSDSRVQNIVSAPLQKTLGLNGCLLQAWACFLAVLMDFLADGSQGSVRSTRRRCRRQCQTPRRGQQCKPPLQTLSGTKSLTPRRLRGPGDSRLRARTASWIRPRPRSRDTPSFASATSRTQHPWRLPFKGCWDAAILLPLPVPTKTSSLAKDHPPAHPAGSGRPAVQSLGR